MILVDTGPLVAIFNARERPHSRCLQLLKDVAEPLVTTSAVLTEAFHILGPESRSARSLREFLRRGGVSLVEPPLDRTLELMDRYLDQRMDFADASLVSAAERLETRRIFTLDRRDFSVYRIRRGRSFTTFEVLC